MLAVPGSEAKQPQAANGYNQSAGRCQATYATQSMRPIFRGGKKQWLALVDRFSGYAWTTALRRLDTKAVILHLENWFNEFGWPTHIRTDGGPQFKSEFKEFCTAHGIQHELSSPYNPESNGLAEAAVKNLKGIVLRCKEKGENIQHARHSCLAKYKPPSRKLSSTALLRATAPFRRKPPEEHRC